MSWGWKIYGVCQQSSQKEGTGRNLIDRANLCPGMTTKNLWMLLCHLWSSVQKRHEETVRTTIQVRSNQKLTLRKMQAKTYPLLNSNVYKIFAELLEFKFIELQVIKQPDEDGKTDDPNYCKHHSWKIFCLQGERDAIGKWIED